MSRQSQNQHRHQQRGQQQRGQRNPPVPAAIDIGDATLLAMREAMTLGTITTNSSDIMKQLYNDGTQFERHEIELLFSNLHGRAIQILISRMSPETFKSTYGQMMLQTWQTVALREVIYALSTAHPMCLRVFRVFKGKVEWVGEDSHRATKEDKGVPEEKSTSTDDDAINRETMRQQVCEDDWIPPSHLTSAKMADPRRVTGEEGEGRGY